MDITPRKFVPTIFEPHKLDYVVVNTFSSQFIPDHDLSKRFSLIWSSMNTGKTHQAIKCIKNNPHLSVLFIVNRISIWGDNIE